MSLSGVRELLFLMGSFTRNKNYLLVKKLKVSPGGVLNTVW
jgi:hypothetical protein